MKDAQVVFNQNNVLLTSLNPLHGENLAENFLFGSDERQMKAFYLRNLKLIASFAKNRGGMNLSDFDLVNQMYQFKRRLWRRKRPVRYIFIFYE